MRGTRGRINRVAGVACISGMWMSLAGFSVPAERGDCRTEDAAFQSLNGGCMDLQTGRVWDASSSVNGTGSVSYGFYKDFCSNNEVGGFTDWRLPSRAELLALRSHETIGTHPEVPSAETTLHVRTWIASRWLWTNEEKGNKVWQVRLSDGATRQVSFKPSSNYDEGICVR